MIMKHSPDDDLLTHPWNTAVMEVMVQMTDDDAESIATTFNMLQFVSLISFCCKYVKVFTQGYPSACLCKRSIYMHMYQYIKDFILASIVMLTFVHTSIVCVCCRYLTATLDTKS